MREKAGYLGYVLNVEIVEFRILKIVIKEENDIKNFHDGDFITIH